MVSLFNSKSLQLVTASKKEYNKQGICYICLKLACFIIGQFTRLLRSLELRAVSHTCSFYGIRNYSSVCVTALKVQ